MDKRGRGRPPKYDQPLKPFPLRVPEDLHEAIRAHADETGVSMNDVVVTVLTRWHRRREKR